jgi:hypothetical protein
MAQASPRQKKSFGTQFSAKRIASQIELPHSPKNAQAEVVSDMTEEIGFTPSF